MTWFMRLCVALLYLGFLYIGWWPVAVVIGVTLAYVFVPYELALTGLLLDIWFASVASLPMYFLIGLGFCFLSLYVMPYLQVRTEHGPLRI